MTVRTKEIENVKVVRSQIRYRSADGMTIIHGRIWKPAGDQPEIRAILQICHGMSEYIERYEEFATFLASRGFLVAGNDHLGHGESVLDQSRYGFFAKRNGNDCVIADIHRLRRELQQRYPETPYFMLGHSMGSFLVGQYIELHGEGMAGAIIMGTGFPTPVSIIFGMGLCRFLAFLMGWHHRSKIITLLTSGNYNRQFKPNRTPVDWLSKVESVPAEFCSNPKSAFSFTINGYYNMFKGILFMEKKKNMKKIPKSLPLLLVSGAKDPVGGNGRQVIAAYQAYAQAGIRHIQGKLYKDDRHELLNESDRETVYRDLLRWMEKWI